jgi:WD40 repeat protein
MNDRQITGMMGARTACQPEDSDDLSLLGELAERFSDQVRRGLAPSIEECARAHPELSTRIRELFPTLLLLEGAGGGAAPAPGTPFGRYRIDREIGRGGMGVVYLAVHQALQKPVALKVLARGAGAETRSLERFLREAQTAAALHHTNIVPVFDVGEVDGTVYYAMQYIAGVGLDEMLRHLGQPGPAGQAGDTTVSMCPDGSLADDTIPMRAPAEVPAPPGPCGSPAWCRWAAQLAMQASLALDYAHERGVVHRDVKPSNLLLDGSGGLWITDFGLAQRPDDPALTHPGLPVGTPRYMSPEQAAAGRTVDHRTDVYSLGVTLYELLAGRPAFTGETPEDVLHQVVSHDPPALRSQKPGVPRDLETIVLRAMARRPEDRYQSAGELADDLGRWLRHEPVRARRIGPLGRAVRWCRRSPVVAGLTLAVASLLVTVAAGASALAFEERAGAVRERQARQEAEEAQEDEARARTAVEKERDATAKALARAEGMRLVLQAQLLVGVDPERALLLAIEGARRHRSPQIDSGLLAVLDANREVRTLKTPFEVRTIRFSRDGRQVLTTNGRGQSPAHLWQVATGKQTLALQRPQAGWLAALSPTGQILVTSATPATAVLWDASTGTVLHELKGRLEDGAEPFSPDGSSIVLPEASRTAGVWDTRTGKKRLTLAGHTGAVLRALFSPDGTRILTASSDQTVRLWDTGTGRVVVTLGWLTRQVDAAVLAPPGRPRLSEFRDARFSSDGKRVLTVDSTYAARLWDAATGKEVVAFRGPVRDARLSPDGRRVLTWSSGPQFAYLVIHDVATGKEVARCISHEDSIWRAAFSPDGRTIASCSDDHTVRLWDAATGQQRAVLRGHQGAVTDVQFSPDGEWLASASNDRTARLWRTASEKERGTRGALDAQFVRVSPDGARVLIPSHRSSVVVRDTQTGKDRFDRGGGLIRPATSAHGRFLLLPSGTVVHVVDARTGKDHTVLKGHENSVSAARFSRDGTQVVTASADGTARVWATATGQVIAVLRGHGAPVRSAAFDSMGKRVVTASADRTARLWDAGSGKELAVLKGHTDEVTDIRFSQDGRRVVTSGRDQTLRIWDATTGAALANLVDADWHRPVCLSAGHVLVLGLKDRTVVRLHQLVDGSEERVLKGHMGRINDAVFSSDGKQVATAADDGTARLWDAGTGKEVQVLLGHQGGVRGVGFSPDGTQVVTMGSDSSVRIWEARTGKEVKKVMSHEGMVLSASFTSGGKGVVIASLRTNVLFRDVSHRREVASLAGHSWQIRDASFSGDGQQAVTASLDGTARLWEVKSGRALAVLVGHEGRVLAARFSPDNKRVATAGTDQTARLWDADTGRQLAVLKGHTEEVIDVVFSADGKRVLTRGRDGTAQLWDAHSGRHLYTLSGHEGTLSAAWFSPNGTMVLTAASGSAPLRIRRGGQAIAGERRVKDYTARLWDAATGKERKVLKHEAGVTAAVFTAKGRQILTCAGPVVRLWDAESNEVRRWKAAGQVMQMDVSPDGRRVLTVVWNGPAQLWDATTGRLAVTLHPGPLRAGGLAGRGEQAWLLSARGDLRLVPTDLLAEALRRKTRELTKAECAEFEVPDGVSGSHGKQ